MHREFMRLLPRARDESLFVVAVVLDVRGFTSFAKIAQSPETAAFLQRIYLRILTEYFPDACFFKPTGDGLIVLLEYTRETLTPVVNRAVERSLRLVEDFPTLCDGDPMITFPVPEEMGIGIARGAVTRLIAGRKTLDVSGRSLNMASRLMDLARPSGVVFEATLGPEEVGAGLLEAFERDDKVYVEGVAPDTPIAIYSQRDRVRIPDRNKRPLNRQRLFHQELRVGPLRSLANHVSFRNRLEHEPARRDAITLVVTHPDVLRNGRPDRRIYGIKRAAAVYEEGVDGGYAVTNYDAIHARLVRAGVKPNWPVRCVLEYHIPDDGSPTSG